MVIGTSYTKVGLQAVADPWGGKAGHGTHPVWQCCLKYFQKVIQLQITKYILKMYFNCFGQ